MNAALSLFVVALVGAEPSPSPGTPPIQYRVKLLEMDGLNWRESLYARLQPIARQGSCAVWTANREVSKAVVDRASRVLMSPQVLAEPDAVAAYSQRTIRKVASQLTRHADGPLDQAVAVAYTTSHEDLREGCQFTMAGRKLDQGMLVKMVVEETRVAAVHQVKLTESVPNQAPESQQGRVTINPQLDVPEVVRATLEGEWLIPNDGVLVASLGAHTLDDGHGKAIVRERLIVVEAGPVPPRTTVDLTQAASRVFTFVTPAHTATLPMPARAPAMPSRSLPIARHADGTPAPLPPLPESQVPPTSIPGTSEPCATPQTAPRPKDGTHEEATPPVKNNDESKSVDPESLTASYQPEPRAAAAPVVPGFDARSAIKPRLLRLPLGPGIELEISAKIMPATKP
jgi:hypothetical protein